MEETKEKVMKWIRKPHLFCIFNAKLFVSKSPKTLFADQVLGKQEAIDFAKNTCPDAEVIYLTDKYINDEFNTVGIIGFSLGSSLILFAIMMIMRTILYNKLIEFKVKVNKGKENKSVSFRRPTSANPPQSKPVEQPKPVETSKPVELQEPKTNQKSEEKPKQPTQPPQLLDSPVHVEVNPTELYLPNNDEPSNPMLC